MRRPFASIMGSGRRFVGSGTRNPMIDAIWRRDLATRMATRLATLGDANGD
jgi:hypothetical protein